MANIPSWVYILIGAIIAIYSKYIQTKLSSDSTAMTLFFWIGVIFILLGLGKMAFKVIAAREKTKKEPKTEQKSQTNIVACPNCKTKHYSTSNFCHKCGANLNR
jgi:membrane-bound ClpP family serine protease